jgi:signal transduction histidine kinase
MEQHLLLFGYAILSLIDLAVGVYVYWRATPQPVSRAFACLALSVALWTVSVALAHYRPTSAPFVVRATFASASAMVLAFLVFLRAFPAGPFSWSPAFVLLALAGLTCIPISLTGLFVRDAHFGPNGLVVAYGRLYPAFGAYVLGSIALGAATVARKARLSSGRERLQIWYLLLGLLVPALGIGTTNLLIPFVFSASHVGLYGPVFTVVFLCLTAHTLIRHRLMDVRLVLSRTISHAIVLVLFGAVFVLCVAVATRIFAPQLALPLAAQAALVFLATALLSPLMRRLRHLLDRYLYRPPYDYQHTVREASRLIASTLSLPRLIESICDIINHSIRPETVAVYLRHLDSPVYSLAATRTHSANPPALPQTLHPTSPLIARLSLARAPLVATDATTVPHDASSRTAVHALSCMGGAAAFPMLEDDRVEGLFVLGPKRSGDPYFDVDVDLLTTLIAHATVGIKNAQLHRRMIIMEGERRRAERLAATTALAAGIAHEIKNPLVAIKTFAELLPERYGDDEFRRDFSKVVIQEIERIDELIARLRGLAAPVSRRLPTSIRPPLDETLALLRGRIEQAGITVVVSADEDLPAIEADHAQLKQLFLNILMNAIEAMPDGGELSIQLRRQTDSDGTGVVVTIADTGTGIPVRLIDRIFDPFVTTKPDGSGLGLSICRSIADAHQATIRADNNPAGRGATVTIQFPPASSLHRSLAGS